jgi:hypothetical protein
MKYKNLLIPFFLLSLALDCFGERDSKQLSLFSIVSFKQEECNSVSTTGLKGTCMTLTECNNMGTSDGNCAAGFGVCCVVSVSTCGDTITQNCSYIDNPSYPTAYTTTGDCSYTVTRCQDDICQIRLDFFSTTLQQPNSADATAGVCTNTILDITGGTTSNSFTNNPPNLCGTLTGQHVYIDSGRAETAATLKFTLATAASNTWRIKVTQIECWNPSRAPEDCLQYYYGNTRHTITSFNWDGTDACSTGCMSTDQEYSVCIRPEKGMCTTAFSQTAVADTLESFGLHNDATAVAEQTEAACTLAYVIIHSTDANSGDRFCGTDLTQAVDGTLGGVVYANPSTGFNFMVVADEVLTNSQAGFSIDATAVACGMSAFGAQGPD